MNNLDTRIQELLRILELYDRTDRMDFVLGTTNAKGFNPDETKKLRRLLREEMVRKVDRLNLKLIFEEKAQVIPEDIDND